MTEAHFEINSPGKVELSERGQEDEKGLYEQADLVEAYDDLYCSVGYGELEGDELEQWGKDRRINVKVSAFHVANEETKRAYHAHLEVALTRKEAVTLRDALSFLIGLAEAQVE